MKMKPKQNVDYRSLVLLVFIAAGLVLLFRLPDLFPQENGDEEAYIANRARIQQMTQTERDRVKHRAGRYFNQLKEDDRNQIRQLHHDLQHDKDAEKLKQVMERYNDWLTSLSPYEREDLRNKFRKATGPEQKRAIIEDYHNVQFVRTLDGLDRQIFDGVTDPNERKNKIAQFRETYRPGMRTGRNPYPAIDIEELDPLINAIQSRLILNNDEKQRLSQLSGSKRYYRTMALALKQRSGEPRFTSGPFSDTGLRQLAEEVIHDSELKLKLLGTFNDRRRVRYILGHSLFKERGKTAGDPTEEQLSHFFATISDERRDELMQTSGSDRKRRLRQWYFRSGGEDGVEFQKYMAEWSNMMGFGGGKFRPPNGGRGPRKGKPSEQKRPQQPNGKRPSKPGPPTS